MFSPNSSVTPSDATISTAAGRSARTRPGLGRLAAHRVVPRTIPNTFQRSMLLAALVLLITPVATLGQIISDGNFDDLAVGSAPDNGVAAGSWSIPVFGPPHEDEIEDTPNQFTIVETSSFDPGSTGNSIRVESPSNYTTTFVENLFPERINQSADEILRASFDVYVPSQEGKLGGLAVHLAAGSSNRGPLMGWDSQGRFNVRDTSVNYLIEETPLDTWQHVQLDIDLMDDSYDFFWSAGDEPLELVAPYVSFRDGVKRSYLDRFGVALYSTMPSRPEGVAYLDNVNIEVLAKTQGDANLDGEVNFADFLTLSDHFGEGSRRDPRGWSQGDFDGNGEVNFPDFLILSENFGAIAAANSSAAAVPEPTGISIALFGLLALIGFRKRR